MKDEKKKGLEEIFKDTKVVKVEVNDELKSRLFLMLWLLTFRVQFQMFATD